jgi:hypothetical protein
MPGPTERMGLQDVIGALERDTLLCRHPMLTVLYGAWMKGKAKEADAAQRLAEL